ncbi:hypothetical protein SASPL_154609 [Salvia splendens]|uniref:DUF1664 domain-containing protein n=1 Tax=Salvia splendens TaxID=180675 RepID=A0A8X8W0C7_SALSN|nr:hypothetical protein SASPL_154609 [Salvia splendens]
MGRGGDGSGATGGAPEDASTQDTRFRWKVPLSLFFFRHEAAAAGVEAMDEGFSVGVGSFAIAVITYITFSYTGTILLKNGKLSDVLAELQNLVKGMEKSGESEGESDYSDAIASQVRRLAMEVRQLASSRQITVLNGNSTQSNLTSLIVPAAAVGALGYGYMWWKGYSFSDLMYVSKQNMANAVSNLTKHLDHVSDALAAAKRHLTQRIENLDGKIDEQIEISKLIRNEVHAIALLISFYVFIYYFDAASPYLCTWFTNTAICISFEMVPPLSTLISYVLLQDGKLHSLEDKQEFANAGVMYLCSIINGKRMAMPERIQDQLKHPGNPMQNLMGLRAIVDSPNSNLLTDGSVHDNKLSKPITRYTISSHDFFKQELTASFVEVCYFFKRL